MTDDQLVRALRGLQCLPNHVREAVRFHDSLESDFVRARAAADVRALVRQWRTVYDRSEALGIGVGGGEFRAWIRQNTEEKT